MADLPTGKNSIGYTGAAQTYTVASGGDLTFKLWGGAGSGGNASNLTPREGYGGAGGFVTGQITVATGDTIKVEVGGGGVTNALTGALGTGGWPDGGPGSYAFTIRSAGSGGGSTRLYVNNVLIAVAGAGGGGCLNEGASGLGYGGAGGGATGQAGTGSWAASGGTQTEGGKLIGKASDPLQLGAYLKGGSGAITSGTGTGTSNDGAGGGGGYYGGGGSAGLWGATVSSGAGGGSSYTHPSVASASTTAGSGKAAPKTDDPDYVAGVARGSDQGSTGVMALPGGNGLAVLEIAAIVPPPELPLGKTFVDYSGAKQTYLVTQAGTLVVKAWGGGGAGANRSNGSVVGGIGGGGGYVTGKLEVAAGDLIEVSVGQGGRGGDPYWEAPKGGAGGWPNGGSGSRQSSSVQVGGGGGGTSVKINGVLAIVAGGGGGAGLGMAGCHGGPGGGEDGAPGYAGGSDTTNLSYGFRGRGGSQTDAGTNALKPAFNGVADKGGDAFDKTLGETAASGGPNPGAGGGGGYYGGAAGVSSGGNFPVAGGGGGSSYIAPIISGGFTVAGERATGMPGGATDPDRGGKGNGSPVSNVASGETPGSATGNHGLDGRVLLHLKVEETTISLNQEVEIDATGTERVLTVMNAGLLSFYGWGGGGAATWGTNDGAVGGGGGAVELTIPVQVGDTLKLEVGAGGGVGSAASGGMGGWPDGGNGGLYSATVARGGGGGSTRLWINGVLKAVASGGGGAGSAGVFGGGAGGALTGAAGGGNNYGVPGGGGTQTEGGVNTRAPTDISLSGGYLKGGNGYFDGRLPSTPGSDAGPGGGGGYYGGAGGSRSVSGAGPDAAGAAGGGSGFLATGLLGQLYSGTGAAPGNTGTIRYPQGVGVGGSSTLTTVPPKPPGSGYAYLILSDYETFGPGKQTLNVTKTVRQFKATSDGVLSFKAWAGGGGSSMRQAATASPSYGGGGAFGRGQIKVKAGDVIAFVVGQGGQGPGTATVSGLGGYPDGGRGAKYEAAGLNIAGSGGGSTRILVNGELALVLGAGGAACSWYAATLTGNGGGGGEMRGSDGEGHATYLGVGGGKWRGGACTRRSQDATSSGSYLRGGDGFAANQTADTAASTNGGPGGGGGYYGGGGGAGLASSSPGGAGGGSCFSTPLILNLEIQDGAVQTPGGATDPDYIAGVGVGAISGVRATIGNGGDGAIIYEFGAESLPELIPDEKAVIPATTRRSYDYVVPEDGTVHFKLWGAAGCASSRYSASAASTSYSGPGGFATGALAVSAGDVVRFEVGQSGGYPQAVAPGGAGWPDGGQGAMVSAAIVGGSGGGSSRVWRNGVLMAVAGGGGGSGSGVDRHGGYGGGLSGYGGAGPVTFAGTGGTQTEGGRFSGTVQPAYAYKNGAYLRGGDGITYESALTSTTSTPGGAGAGGGYYGGGAGGSLVNANASGSGGGSGYIHPDLNLGAMETSATRDAPRALDPDYIAGVAQGALAQFTGTTELGMRGGDGLGVFTFTPGALSIPGDAFGLIGEVALAAPLGSALGSHDVQRPLPGPILLTSTQGGVVVAGPPKGEALPPIIVEPVLPDAMMNGNAQGEIGTIVLEMNLVAGPTTEALIQIPLVDYNLTTVPPEGVAAGSINIITPFPGLIRTTAPRASINGYTTIEPFEHDLVMSAPTAIADQGFLFQPEFPGPIVLEAPDGAPSAGASITPPHFGTPPNDYYGLIRFTPPDGYVQSDDMDTIVDLPGPVQVNGIDGFAMEGVDAFGEPLTDINLTAVIDGTAAGNANAYPDKPPAQPYLALVQTSPMNQVEVTGEVDFHTPDEPMIVRVNPIEGMTEYAATILASILPAMIELRSPAGLGGLEIDGLGAGEEFPVIRVGEPHAYVDSDMPGFAPLRYWRSSVPTRAPAELEEREIALNEADGVLFTRDAQGDVRPTALSAISRGASVPDAGEVGDMLRGDGVWGLMTPLYDDAIRLEPPAEARIFLAEDILQRESASPAAGEVVFQPFFVPRPTRISDLSITVVTPASGQAHLGLARWSLQGRTEGYLATGVVSLASGGLKSVSVDLMLRTGWYVSVLGMTASTQLSGVKVASQVDVSTFQPVGALACPLEGDLTALIQPMARAATNHAYITARVS